MAKKKVDVVKKEIMNKIIKIMARKQNPKNKLNAGQLREAVSLFVSAVVELEESPDFSYDNTVMEIIS